MNYKEINNQIELDAILILIDNGYTDTDKYSIDKKVWHDALLQAFNNLPAKTQYEYIFSCEKVKEHFRKLYPLDSIISKYKGTT